MIIKEESLNKKIEVIEKDFERIKNNDVYFRANIDYWRYKGQLEILYEIRGYK